MSNQIIILDMINKKQVGINNKMFTAENNILILKIKPQNYDLTDKVITANFSRTEVETIPLKVIDGIIQLPIYSNLIKYGTNYIQLNFRWDANKLEQSGKLMWVIDKSLETEGVAQEEVDIITYLVNIATQAKKDADDLVEVVQGKLDNGEFIGPIGPQGIQGEQGEQGIQGLKGDKGDQGIQGIQGIQGPKGDTGLQGPKGDKGDQGIQGPKGDTGLQGPKGDKGDQGIQGPKGDTGLQGPKGDKGDKGEPGEVTLAELGAVQSELAAHKEEYVQYKDNNNLKIAKVEKDINDYQSTMATMNPNQEVKQKVSGYGTVSLPENSANGQVSVSVKGETLTNIAGISNNHPALDITGIRAIYLNNNGTLGASANLKMFNVKQGEKYLIRIKLKSESQVNIDRITWSYVGTPVSGLDSKDIYGILTVPSDASDTFIYTQSVPGQTGSLLFDYVFIYNITGETEADINKLLQKYPYVSNTKSTISASRLKSVGRNKIKNENFKRKTIANGVINDNNATIINGPIKIKNNTTYSYSGQSGTYHRLYWYDADMNYISASASSSVLPINNQISPSNAKYVYILITKATDFTIEQAKSMNLQLEEGAVATQYEPYTESTSYLPNVGELRSLPNGTKDEVGVSGGKAEHIKRVSDDISLSLMSWDRFTVGDTDNFWCVHAVILPTYINSELIFINNYIRKIISTFLDFSRYDGYVWRVYSESGTKLNIKIPKSEIEGTIDNAKAKAWFEQKQIILTYQLASPIITPVEVSGNLVSYPSGTVYVEKVLPVAGIYNNGITVTHTDFPISSLDKISKVDFMTGVETQLDISKVVIAGDKKSFTHPDLANGNIVFFEYFYDIESTLGECEIEHYDSRHVLKDSVTGKFYKIVPTVANGVLTNGLVEV